MTHTPVTTTEARGLTSSTRPRAARWVTLVAACAAAWSLSACGGGAYVDSAGNVTFDIGITIAGQFVEERPVVAGGSLDLVVRAGQSVVLDAGEPAVWTMVVGGSAVTGGAQVYYAGADITGTTVGRSRIAIDTYAEYLLPSPIPITLVATSTYDSAQVATVNLLITN